MPPGNCWKERILLRKLTWFAERVVEVIAKEVDDERRRKQQQKKIAAAAEQVDRSTGPVDRTCTTCASSRSVDRPVDRLK